MHGWMGLHRSIDQSINWSKIRYELNWTASASASAALFYLQLPNMNEDKMRRNVANVACGGVFRNYVGFRIRDNTTWGP